MKLADWSRQEGITYQTAWRWFKAGKLPVEAYKTPSGAIIVRPAEVESEGSTIVYARVSSHEKRGDLERQAQRCAAFCASRGWVVERIVQEIGSGMNDERRKLCALLSKPPARLVVEHKDRLTRFGFNYLEMLLGKLGCEVVVINRDDSERDDLMKDLVAVITSFCCRLYGQRRGATKAKAATEAVT
jgi:predicted site-specific integrase-resolvase